MTDVMPVGREMEMIAHDFAVAMRGAMDERQIDAAVESILAPATSYPATGSIVSAIFYLQFQVKVKDGGKTFNGKAGGISTPGGGALLGAVQTNDINRLYADTASFFFSATAASVALIFFDRHHNSLGGGTFGAVSIVSGTGGGPGSWS